ncbi:hypothetical protein TWF281_011151 [Arthrobotrys megalospora]
MRLPFLLPFLPIALSSPVLLNPRQATTTTHVCNADNLLRALRNTANVAQAATFCGAFLSITSTTTISVPSTVISTKTAVTTIFYKRDDGSYGSYNPEEEDDLKKRSASCSGSSSSVPYPSWLAATYPASRVSSACKCMTLPEVSTTVLVTKYEVVTVGVTESVKTSESTTTEEPEPTTTTTQEPGTTTTSEEPEPTTSEEPEPTTTEEPESTTTTEEPEPETTTSSEEPESTTTTEEPETTTTSDEPETATSEPPEPTTTTEEPEPTTTEEPESTTTTEEPEPTTTSEEPEPTTTSEEPQTTTEEPEPETTTTEDPETTTTEPDPEPTTTTEPEPEPTTTSEPETTTSEDPTSTTADPTTTTTPPTGTPTVYLGCWIDAISGKALRYQYPDDTLTPSVCAAICSTHGYTYYGVEYGRECYCDNAINPASFQVLSGECDVACAGDSAQICGGRDRINIYTFDTNIEGSDEPDLDSDEIEYTSMGCYQEPPAGKALSKVFSSGQMTHELCQYYCWSLGESKFAGVEYGRECWCGNDLNPAATPASSPSSCNMPCAGDNGQTCGAGGYIELYSSGVPVPTTTSTSSTTTSPPSTTTTSDSPTSTLSTAAFTTPTGTCNPVEWSSASGYNFHFTSDDALSQWTVSGVSSSVTSYFVTGSINPSALQLLFSASTTVTLTRIIPVTPGITYSITWHTYHSSSASISFSAVSDNSVTDIASTADEYSSTQLTITPTVDSITLAVIITGIEDSEAILDAVDIRPISAGTFTPPTLGEIIKILILFIPSGAGSVGYTTGIDGANARLVEFGPVPFSATVVKYTITASLTGSFPAGEGEWVVQTKVQSENSNGCFVGVSFGNKVVGRTPLSGCREVWEDVGSVPFAIGSGGGGCGC